jgi:hypothetical protein
LNHDYLTTLLEDVYEPRLSPFLPIVVFDFKVYAHNINKLAPLAAEAAKDEEELKKIMKAMWAYKLNRGPDMLPQFPFVGIIVDDLKGKFTEEFSEASTTGMGYWRHIEAHKISLDEYKGGRGEKTPYFDITEAAGYEYVRSTNSPYPYFAKEFFEADDIAGMICRMRREADSSSALGQRQIILSTVDGDWQGLVSDSHDIVWANTGPWLPRLRSEVEVCDYYLRKDKHKISSAKECYNVKENVGDLGDNLQPGTPLRFFDLYEADSEWCFNEEDTNFLSQVLNSNTPSNRLDHLESAERFIRAKGLFLPIVGETESYSKQSFFEKAKKTREEAEISDLKGRNKKICLEVIGEDDKLKKCKELVVKDEKAREQIKTETETLDKCKEADDKKCIKAIRAIIKTLKQTRADIKLALSEFVSAS